MDWPRNREALLLVLDEGRWAKIKKPRQCTIDERWWTAGKIDGLSSLSRSAMQLITHRCLP